MTPELIEITLVGYKRLAENYKALSMGLQHIEQVHSQMNNSLEQLVRIKIVLLDNVTKSLDALNKHIETLETILVGLENDKQQATEPQVTESQDAHSNQQSPESTRNEDKNPRKIMETNSD